MNADAPRAHRIPHRDNRPLAFCLSLAAAVAASAVPAAAQAPRECLLQYQSPTGNTRTTALQLPSKRYNVFQGGGIIYHCEGQDNTIIADSSEYYGDQSVLYLIGHVHYRETRAKVDSDRMTYYQLEDRLHAEGNVSAVLQSGTTMNGPVVDYYRVTPARPMASVIATGHPTMRLIQRNPSGQPSEPVNVVANQIVSQGENLVFASGAVEITRPDILAKGDSAFLDSQREFARLMRSPTVDSKRDRKFTLSGGVIDLYSRNRVLQRVVATPSGHVLSDDLELVADSVDLRMSNDKLERVMAWGKNRARAVSPDRDITADSIDAIMPGQRLREVRAVRKAYANTAPDTAHFVSTERDWMRGELIVAEFDSIPAGDTTSKPRPRRIVATGDASSFYQLAGNNRVSRLPNINYVKGRVITVLFADREVSTVEVVEEASGVYVEPTPPGAATATGNGATSPKRTATPASPPKLPIGRIRKNEP
jgi:lipopolysaccharide export system protein LptA